MWIKNLAIQFALVSASSMFAIFRFAPALFKGQRKEQRRNDDEDTGTASAHGLSNPLPDQKQGPAGWCEALQGVR